MIETQKTGSKDGKDIFVYTFSSEAGGCMKVTNYGGTIMSVEMPDADGNTDAARVVTEPAAPREPLRVVFMGTPGFAAVIMRHLLEWDGCDVIAAYTQPDRPCGRGQQCRPPEVKLLAMEHGVPVYQPLNFKTEEAVAE